MGKNYFILNAFNSLYKKADADFSLIVKSSWLAFFKDLKRQNIINLWKLKL